MKKFIYAISLLTFLLLSCDKNDEPQEPLINVVESPFTVNYSITITETLVTSDVSMYHLTFDGVLFDGYQKQKLENQKEQERMQSLAEKTVNLSERLTSLTFWIMFGTLTMAAYAIFQTVIYFFCE